MTDKIVCVVVVALACFGLGVSYGRQVSERHIYTTCAQQKGEQLAATVQTADGVRCVYSLGYGRAKITRGAS